MKNFLHFILVIASVTILNGCAKKDLIVPQDPVVGSWILVNALEGDAYGWQPILTGLENGVFDFYSTGEAVYSDQNYYLSGHWYITPTSGPYYDEYGSYYNGYHQSFDVHATDGYHNSIDLHFDNIRITGNQMYATYFNGNFIESYTFQRYY